MASLLEYDILGAVVAQRQFKQLLLSGVSLEALLARDVQLSSNGEFVLLLQVLLLRHPRLRQKLLLRTLQVVHDVLCCVGHLRADQHLRAGADVGHEFEGEELEVVGGEGDLESVPGAEEFGL